MDTPIKYRIESITITVSSKLGLPNYSSVENSTSFTFSKADGTAFTESEAEVASMEMSEKLRQKVILDEIAQGVRDPSTCKEVLAKMHSAYVTVRNKISEVGG